MAKYILLLIILFSQTVQAQDHCGVPSMYITAAYDKEGKLIPKNYPILLTGNNCTTITRHRRRKCKRFQCGNYFTRHQLDSLKRIDERIDSFLNRQNKKQ